MNLIRKILKPVARAILFFFISANVHAATTDLATAPLVTSAQSSVLPNLMLLLDDSGSMDWDFLPDWATTSYLPAFKNNDYNGVAYSPAVVYSPPVFYTTTGTLDTTTYPAMSSGNTSAYTSVPDDGYGVQRTTKTNLTTGTNNQFYTFVPGEYCSAPNLRNCVLATAPSVNYPYAATLRWCTNDAISNCQAIKIDSGATLYQIPRSPPLAATSTITVKDTNSITITVAAPSGATSTSVTGITATGVSILSAATAGSTNTTTVATAIKNNINTCMADTVVCNPGGAKDYIATSSTNVVTVTGTSIAGTTIAVTASGGAKPLTFAVAYQATTSTAVSAVTVPSYTRLDGTTRPSTNLLSGGSITTAAGTTAGSTNVNTVAANIANKINTCHATPTCDDGYTATALNNVVTITAPLGISVTPTVTDNGSMTFAATAFNGGTSGSNLLTTLTSGNSYPYPGTATKAGARVDCAGSVCTYAEEMVNYANWWAYYHTRMQMMKTSATVAFQTVGANFRVGYQTINNTQTLAFLNPAPFAITPTNQQKRTWYQKLIAAKPGSSTPLRDAVANVGRYYSGKLAGTNVNGVAAVDPMQYSCQQNFTIVATDGYWNETVNPTQINGTTAIGQQDGTETRPYNDGASVTVTTTTVTQTTNTTQTKTPATVQTLWTHTAVTPGGICPAASLPPAGCVQDNGSNSAGTVRTWCMVGSTTGASPNNQCTGAVSPGGPYLCRGIGSPTATPDAQVGGTATTCSNDSGGQSWCAFNAPINTSCTQAIPGDNIYVCNPAVTTAVQTTTQTQSGNRISTDNRVTTTTTTQAVTNNIPGTPSITTTGPVVTNVPPLTTDIIPPASPPAGATWATTSSVTDCSPPYAAIGTSTPVITTVTGPTPTGPAGSPVVVTTMGPVVIGTPAVVTTSTGGTSNTLADVAEYYYATDLRNSTYGNCTGSPVPPATTGGDVCTDNVPSSGLDAASWQHMTLFTMALGASGFMQYQNNYQAAKSGDYFDVANGNTANPGGGICAWQASGGCNWPVPVSNTQTTIDDLWHAAVNGRGTYFSATNPASLGAGLQSALSGVSARTGSSSAATTSNPNVTSGDNFVFSSTFTTNFWDGELQRQQLDLVTGAVLPSIDWAAQAQLDANLGRTIYSYYSGATGSKFRLFDWATISAAPAPQLPYFTKPNIAPLSQFCASGSTCLTAAAQTLAAGQNLVQYLRGDRSNEGDITDPTTYYRARNHLLGDIVNAEAVYVKTPLQAYVDTGFAAYATTMKTRQGMVYVAANDGMLHAFNADTGAETWAYIPELVLPNLYKLADKNYAGQHRYYTDGTPISGDAFFNGTWHTIVVAGLNDGGRGYYAMDVTNPAAPVGLWEFTNDNIGYTYGNPVITKLASGQWVVVVSSGYNNVPDGTVKPNGVAYQGDGVGRLFVLDAGTGALINTITTGQGSPTTPSGLSRISGWVDNATSNNTSTSVYGGDLLGNVWRFDINSTAPAVRLVTLYANAAGTVTQPITAKPELGDVGGVHMVYVGTGEFLGISDLNNTTQQSFYGIKDPLGVSPSPLPWPNPKGPSSSFVQQNLTNGSCPAGSPATICTLGQSVRTSTSKAVNLALQSGWFIDLPDGVGDITGTIGSERANTDPTLALGTLGFTTNIPNQSACAAGGYSYRYLLDYRTGAPVSTSITGVSAIKLGNALATRGVFVRLPNNTVVQLTRLSTGQTTTTNVPIGTAGGPTRRVSWRELIQDQ